MQLLIPENSLASSSCWRFSDFLCIFSFIHSFNLLHQALDETPTISSLPPEQMQNLFSLKPKGEFYLAAKAFPPRGEAPAVKVSAAIGGLTKELVVFGHRFWVKRAGVSIISDPRPFSSMEISWENAFGGPNYPPNPLGKGTAPVKTDDGREAVPLPNVELPDQLISSPNDRPEPAGFSPFGPNWPQRSKMLGTFDDRWIKGRWPWFPEDFDPAYFNAAPPDQQLDGFFRGDEPIRLENMHPEKPVIHSRLPGLRLRAFLTRKKADGDLVFQEVPMNLDTLWLIPHEETLVLAWHGAAETVNEDAEDIVHFMALTEALDEPAHPLDYYHELFLERLAREESPFELEPEEEAEGKAGALVEEASEPEAPAAAEITQEDSGGDEAEDQGAGRHLLAGLEAELKRAEEELKDSLKAAGIDPASFFKGLEVTEEKASEVKPAGPELLKKLEKELKEAEDALRKTLKEVGIDPAAFFGSPEEKKTPGPGRQKGLPPSAADIIDSLKRLGVSDPALEKELLQIEEETKRAEQELKGLMEAWKEGPSGSEEAKGSEEGPSSVEREGTQEGREEPEFVWTRQTVEEHFRAGGSFSGADLSGLDLSRLELPGADFKGAVLEGTLFSGADLSGADFSEASAAKAEFSGCDLKKTLFIGAEAEAAIFDRAHLEGADFTGATLPKASFKEAVLDRAVLKEADLSETLFEGADLRHVQAEAAEFIGARISGSSFSGSELTYADFSGAVINKTDFARSLAANSSFHGAEGEQLDFTGADLKGSRADEATRLKDADFSGADLSGACWEGSSFDSVLFRGARLERANFSRASFSRADFYHARARFIIMDKAAFKESRLIAADFFRSRFEAAQLADSELTGSNFFETEFWNLAEVRCRWDLSNLKRTKLEGKQG